ncbi:hypothetical protein EGW08_017593 [Elysia chlorotica]|uniref:G-protein coupled receptors family 1 profile domain-containing protein n=1 Tax=Elysia chlorotica TaxID=188477 RepID=A0A433SZ89_ELYCH|nr:hypothetical protein EGW08_017593 [Elysia chlorotica]
MEKEEDYEKEEYGERAGLGRKLWRKRRIRRKEEDYEKEEYLKICHPTKRSLNALQARNIGVGTPVLAALVAAPLLFWEGNAPKARTPFLFARYLKICHPTKRSLNALQARNIGVGTPVLAALVAAPLLFWEGNVDRRFCRIQDRYRHTLGVRIHLCSSLGFFIIIFVLVIFCYTQVSLAVRRRIQRHRENALKRKHLLQIPAFIQARTQIFVLSKNIGGEAISNVDETPGGSDPKLSKGKRKFSLFNIGSSRRLSVIAPWVKARLSLPNDATGGVNSRAASRASGASSNSSLSINHRKRKKKSISTSGMILSEKGESGADEENKESDFPDEQEAKKEYDSIRKSENGVGLNQPGGNNSGCCVIYNLPEKVIVTDTTGADIEREETFSYNERSRPIPPLFKQEHVIDFDRRSQEFQRVSDRGRTLGAAFLFADAPVRRSLEEEWELEMARVARERRISTDSALRRPSEPENGKPSTTGHALLTWIAKWRRRAFNGGQALPRNRQESFDAQICRLEETERLFPSEAETSFSNNRAHKWHGYTSVSAQSTELDEADQGLLNSLNSPFQLEVSPCTPRSSLRQIGRQKTSIEETEVAPDLEIRNTNQDRLLQVASSPRVQGGSDSNSSCLSLFDHVVCVHQADSPGRNKFSRPECPVVCADSNEANASRFNLKDFSTESITSKDKAFHHIGNGLLPQNVWNKSDSQITKGATHQFSDLFKFGKSRSLSSSKLKKSSKESKKEDFKREPRCNSCSRKVIHSVGHCDTSFVCAGLSSISPSRSLSLPERLKKIFRSQDSSDELLIEEPKHKIQVMSS